MRYRIIENGFPAYLGVMWFRRFVVILSYLGGLNESGCNPWVPRPESQRSLLTPSALFMAAFFQFSPAVFFDCHGVTRARDRDFPEIRERVSSLLCLFLVCKISFRTLSFVMDATVCRVCYLDVCFWTPFQEAQ